jgi:hypothetical protein
LYKDYDDLNVKVDLRQQNLQKILYKANEIENKVYYQPQSKNFLLIDSLIAFNKVF